MVESLPVCEELRKTFEEAKKDPLLSLLLKRSSLSDKQLQTLIIETYLESAGQSLTTEQKASIRGVSKGSFVRTLRQALRNVERAFYTVILMGYLGALDLPKISKLQEIGQKVRLVRDRSSYDLDRVIAEIKDVMLGDNV